MTLSASSSSGTYFGIVSEYANRVLPADDSMKVLLLDRTTLPILSVAFSQTALLQRGIFLVDCIDSYSQRSRMKNMRCIIFMRAEVESVEAACNELRSAKYSDYSIILCGPVSPEVIDTLARADVEMLVNRVEEVFCDFEAVNSCAFVMATSPPVLLASRLSASQSKRVAESLASLMVAQRRRPHIRFQRSSSFAQRVATDLLEVLRSDPELYDYRPRDTTLLIIDRSDDPLTALLTPWTYQAMLHEHICLDHNKLYLPPECGGDDDGYVFAEKDDSFFAANMYHNWGDLCSNVKSYVDKCKEALNLDRSTATMEEIKQFMQRLPQTQSLTGTVTKHATVTSHLSTVIKRRDLLQISLLEQDMIASFNQSDHWSRLQAFAGRDDVVEQDLVRLCLLYNLRYEKAGQPSRTLPILERFGPTHFVLLRKLREYYGVDRSTDGLFADTGVMASIVKTFLDVGNIYTQHECVLKRTLQQLFSGRLDKESYPYVSTPPTHNVSPASLQGPVFKPKEVIAFVCGGFTFEEVALIHNINNGTAYKSSETSTFVPGGVKASIGGTGILNTSTFLRILGEL